MLGVYDLEHSALCNYERWINFFFIFPLAPYAISDKALLKRWAMRFTVELLTIAFLTKSHQMKANRSWMLYSFYLRLICFNLQFLNLRNI